MKKKNYLLVEPSFPIPGKSKNHKDFLPIGLLKLATWLKTTGNEVQLVRGNLSSKAIDFIPDEIWITSLFTYWSKYVRDSVLHYTSLYPAAKTVVGGVYASLMPDHCKEYTECDEIFVGVHPEAEKILPNYSLLPSNPHPIDFQIIHSSRGCERKCEFCGTWKIEPSFLSKNSITLEVTMKNLVFYDNNLLANPHIEDILSELIELKNARKISWCESQSGFDGRVLIRKPKLGTLLKQAGFRSPRIAWDWKYDQRDRIKKQLKVLFKSGYKPKEVYVFVLYNWDIPFKEMERKRTQCYRWGVQIADCRFRPLNQTFDEFSSRKKNQTNADYYIHDTAGWTDQLVKQFRKNVRRQNICVRHGFPFYSQLFERKKFSSSHSKCLKSYSSIKEKENYLRKHNIEYWIPSRITFPKSEQKRIDQFI